MNGKSSRPPRSLTDIRTLAGKSQDGVQRGYATYFEMGALELERLRRSQEREAALRRVGEIERRIAEIDAEMAQLQGAVAADSERRAEVESALPSAALRPTRSRRRGGASNGAEGAAPVIRADSGRAQTGEPGEGGPRRGLRIRY
ncbi:hypothetical protein [Thiohalocapsa sp. ML1]|jgi:hypothetical protein|uniref:hypothetical protein n=1 Tax=Thiohalocapsa sp. ML1 TaxID=1431688 RepID=UPI000732276C|nr:hypothetical protein [Thiohalocapsa sp. ML1]